MDFILFMSVGIFLSILLIYLVKFMRLMLLLFYLIDEEVEVNDFKEFVKSDLWRIKLC